MTAPQAVLWVYVVIVGLCALTALYSLGAWAFKRLRRRRARKEFERGLRIMGQRWQADREVVQRRMFADLNQDEIAAAARSLRVRLEDFDRRHR